MWWPANCRAAHGPAIIERVNACSGGRCTPVTAPSAIGRLAPQNPCRPWPFGLLVQKRAIEVYDISSRVQQEPAGAAALRRSAGAGGARMSPNDRVRLSTSCGEGGARLFDAGLSPAERARHPPTLGYERRDGRPAVTTTGFFIDSKGNSTAPPSALAHCPPARPAKPRPVYSLYVTDGSQPSHRHPLAADLVTAEPRRTRIGDVIDPGVWSTVDHHHRPGEVARSSSATTFLAVPVVDPESGWSGSVTSTTVIDVNPAGGHPRPLRRRAVQAGDEDEHYQANRSTVATAPGWCGCWCCWWLKHRHLGGDRLKEGVPAGGGATGRLIPPADRNGGKTWRQSSTVVIPPEHPADPRPWPVGHGGREAVLRICCLACCW